jgi:hypothetical protein
VILNTENRGVAKKHRTMGVANRHNQDSCSPMMIPSIQVKKKVMYCHLPLSPARDSRSFLQTVFLIVVSFHERTIALRFLGIILRVLRLEVSVWIS